MQSRKILMTNIIFFSYILINFFPRNYLNIVEQIIFKIIINTILYLSVQLLILDLCMFRNKF